VNAVSSPVELGAEQQQQMRFGVSETLLVAAKFVLVLSKKNPKTGENVFFFSLDFPE